MAAILQVPRDLIPVKLVCIESVPKVVKELLDESTRRWYQGETGEAIRCAEQARDFAEAGKDWVNACIAMIWLTDICREASQLGAALVYCDEARSALTKRPNYRDRYYYEAVISYMRGLICHALGAHPWALASYQDALKSFDKAKIRLGSRVGDISIEDSCYQKDVCNAVVEWIQVLCQCLASDISSVITPYLRVYFPVVDDGAGGNARYRLEQMEFVNCVIPRSVKIEGQDYYLYQPTSGMPFDEDVSLTWDTRRFVVRVPEEKQVGDYEGGDYVLLIGFDDGMSGDAPSTHTDPEKGAVYGNREWELGEFVRDEKTGKVEFVSISKSKRVLGKEDRGVVKAVLKKEPPDPDS